MGIDAIDFYEAISSFRGAAKRMELLAKGESAMLFKDFAHAPSKVRASVQAVLNQFKKHRIIACFELHTYSSTDPTFMEQYKSVFDGIDQVVVYFDHAALKIKKRLLPEKDQIKKAFGLNEMLVINDLLELENIFMQDLKHTILLMMSSGNFGGLQWSDLSKRVAQF